VRVKAGLPAKGAGEVRAGLPAEGERKGE
jgi:hypothetical protein